MLSLGSTAGSDWAGEGKDGGVVGQDQMEEAAAGPLWERHAALASVRSLLWEPFLGGGEEGRGPSCKEARSQAPRAGP